MRLITIFLLLSLTANAQKGKITYKGMRIVMNVKDINIPKSQIVKYEWTQVSGPTAWIVSPKDTATWISDKEAKDLKKGKAYKFRFTATNAIGLSSYKDVSFVY